MGKGRPKKYQCEGKTVSFWLTNASIAKLKKLSSTKNVSCSHYLNYLIENDFKVKIEDYRRETEEEVNNLLYNSKLVSK